MSIYYVNQLPNKINNYKYNLIKGVDAFIDIRQNYWFTEFYLYSYNNFLLPTNSLMCNLKIPYQTIDNIYFNEVSSDFKNKKYNFANDNYCKIYEAICSFDITNNNYLKLNLTNAKINWQLNFEIDPNQFLIFLIIISDK